MYERRKVLEEFENQYEATQERIKTGIETYRKTNAKVTIIDNNGAPVKGAAVKIKQKNHEFRFGANIFMLDELESVEKNEKYKKCFADTFNMATLPFYWDALEPERGKPRYSKDSCKVYRRPSPDTCIEFCEEHGIEPREHALAYEQFFPKWLKGASVAEVKKELERRFFEISKRYADKINTIEVTNEMEWESGVTEFYDQPDFVEWCFKLAEKYFPKNQLCINDHTGLSWNDRCRATDKYYAYIEANMLKGARIDAIGMQYHLFNTKENEYNATRPYLNPQNLYRHMDLYSNFKKPLQITEVTVPAYSWEKEDEQLQADIIENVYSVWFSHPNVEQIIYWNLVDGYAHVWDPDPEKIKKSQGNMQLGENCYYGGLLRFDLSPKPAYERIKYLIKEKWHTEEMLVTDENGCAEFTGFFGDYEIEIKQNGSDVTKTIALKRNKDTEFVLKI